MIPRRRLLALTAAGLIDSLCLSAAWTVLLLDVVGHHGLAAAGAFSAAMLIGVALSAPVAHRASQLLGGRRLLRTSASIEAVLRVAVAVLVLGGAPLWVSAPAVTLLNVLAWTGYAGMRAEVAALGLGSTSLTTYGTAVAAVEAGGVAVAAFLPLDGDLRTPLLVAVMGAYVLALLPTFVVAGGSPVAPAGRRPTGQRRESPLTPPVVAGALLMLLASGPTLLSVALTEQLFGRTAVPAAALAFTAGSLLAPWAARVLDRRAVRSGPVWWAMAGGMAVGWSVASQSVALLCLAQLLSGLCMTLLEGLLDTAATEYRPQAATGALAMASAGRAFGSAGSTAVLPAMVAGAGLGPSTGALAVLLGAAALAAGVAAARRRAPHGRHRHPGPQARAARRVHRPTLAVPLVLSPGGARAPSLVLSRRDLDFLLHEWLQVETLTKRERFAGHDRETFDAVLDLAAEIATEHFAPHNRKADENEPHVVDGKVVLIPEVAAALKVFGEAGLAAGTLPE